MEPQLRRAEALQIIEDEELSRYVWFDKPGNRADHVAIFEGDGGWFVENTDERAVVGAVREFDNESDALELFIRRLRLSKRL